MTFYFVRFTMRFRIIGILLMLIVSGACTSNTIYKKPNDLISKNQMIDIMTDLYIAKSAYHVKNINQERKINYTAMIFEKYGIDSTRFSNSNIYYMSKIDEYEKMHKVISERIEEMIKERDSFIEPQDELKLAE